MSKIYLVDSENIGASWSQLLPSMSKEDKMFVFYTEKSPYISYDNLLQVIAHCDIPVFIKCFEGKNALDFQLVSELGFKLCLEPEAEFIIVSDDYGYDAAIRYWKGKLYNVHRIGKKFCRPMQPRKEEENAAVQTAAEETSALEAQAVEQENVSVAADTNVTATIEVNEPVAEAGVPAAESEMPEAEHAVSEESAETSGEPETQQESGTESEVTSAESEMPAVEKAAESTVIAAEETVEYVVIAAEEAVEPVVIAAEEAVEPQVAVEKVVKPEMPAAEVDEVQPEAPLAEQEIVTDSQLQPEAQSDAAEDEQQATHAQKRTKDRRRKHKKEPAKEPEKAVEESETQIVDPLDTLLLDITRKCVSPEPEKDAYSVKELFRSVSMSNLTNTNTALKILIGNELGNDIYRELKEHQECRQQLDALYLPDMKKRFMKYVQTVLERSELEGITVESIGDFLLGIPRRNLNSIRSAIIKEYGHDQGSLIYTEFKPHIKVLNKI